MVFYKGVGKLFKIISTNCKNDLKNNKGERVGRPGEEIKSNVMDGESANIMKSRGVVQEYNGQALMDEKIKGTVNGEAPGERQGHYDVAPMVGGGPRRIWRRLIIQKAVRKTKFRWRLVIM